MRTLRRGARLPSALILSGQVIAMVVAMLGVLECRDMTAQAGGSSMAACPVHDENSAHASHGESHEPTPCDCPKIDCSDPDQSFFILNGVHGVLVESSALTVRLPWSEGSSQGPVFGASVTLDSFLPPPRG